ncbi:MAG: hypothetical protein KGK11_06550 [Sphingomonadales bacterium]|nr:hypothetical protein [Sphingomonadales bacterium]
MDQTGPVENSDKTKGGWRRNLKIVAYTILYMIPLFWMWNKAGYPDGFGIHITAHGKSGLLENWYYSYPLIQRGQFLDIMLFIYMWAVIVLCAGWVAWSVIKSRRSRRNLRQQKHQQKKSRREHDPSPEDVMGCRGDEPGRRKG